MKTPDITNAARSSLNLVVQSFDSAPRDGTEILAWREDAGWLLIRWVAPCDFLNEKELEQMALEDTEDPDWFYADFVSGGRLDCGEPTHWMPMPDAPNADSSDGANQKGTPMPDKPPPIPYSPFAATKGFPSVSWKMRVAIRKMGTIIHAIRMRGDPIAEDIADQMHALAAECDVLLLDSDSAAVMIEDMSKALHELHHFCEISMNSAQYEMYLQSNERKVALGLLEKWANTKDVAQERMDEIAEVARHESSKCQSGT